jgi:hypothetical protein
MTNGLGIKLRYEPMSMSMRNKSDIMRRVAIQPIVHYFFVTGDFYSYRAGVYFPPTECMQWV